MAFFGTKKRDVLQDARIREGLAGLERAHRSGRFMSTDNDRQALSAIKDGFAAAKRDRLTDDWTPSQVHPASLHRADAKVMRDRARDLILSNPMAKAGVDAFIANVIEVGISPKPAFDDIATRKSWDAAWSDWAGEYNPQADVTETQHFCELQSLFLEEVLVGGGCLTHFVDVPRKRGRRIPLAVELIAEERFADENDSLIRFQAKQKSANPIVRGVELDAASGRPVRYWIKPADLTGYDLNIDPIGLPAEDCRYAFFKRRIGQTRGYTLLHAAIMWLWKLGYYTDNELMASAIKSCFTAVIKTEQGPSFPTLSDGSDSSSDDNGNLLEKLQPGIVARLKPGESIEGIGPNVPASSAEAWIVFIQRSIGVAMGLSYEELCRDYSRGNFSSTRASANADRKRFRMLQKFVINHFCAPIYQRFAMSASLTGLEGFPTPAEFSADMESWLKVSWRCPGWASVTPLEDARADDIKLRNGSRTLDEIGSHEGGRDWEERLEQRAREEDKADSLNLRIAGSKDDPESPMNQNADAQGGNVNGN